MSETTLGKDYKERIVPELQKEFKYTSVMQVPRLEKIVINQGLGAATQDKKTDRNSHQRAYCHHRPESSADSFKKRHLELQVA